MKPNYCSGGTFASGQISSNRSKTDSNGNNANAKIILGDERQQQKLSYRGSSSLNYSTSASPSSPNFIVYRSAKYISPHARVLQILRSYAKFYVFLPIALFANRCKDAFYLGIGLLIFLLLLPSWILILTGLFILRRLRLFLIKRLYPDMVELGDHSSQISPISNSTESNGIVNSLIWIKGKLDANIIRQRFKLLFTENPRIYNLLRLNQVSKYGAKLWEQTPDFQLENHIVEAPKTFHNCPLVDEPLKELYRTGSKNKSILQKYVSYCVSMPLDCSNPPWKIHIVSYISRDDGVREKTCLVIRMHVTLIKNNDIREALRELFLNSVQCKVGGDGEEDGNGEFESAQVLKPKPVDKNDSDVGKLDLHSLMDFIKNFEFRQKIHEFMLAHQKNLIIWINLRMKQLEFHSKTAVLSIICVEIKDSIKRYLNTLHVFTCKTWAVIMCYIAKIVTIVQAFAAVPMIILVSIMRSRNFRRLGLQRHPVPGKKLISWSDLIHGDLAAEICEKLGTSSPENVLLMACMNALREYYQQNNMPTPQKIGFMVGNADNTLEPSTSLKAIRMTDLKVPYGAATQANELFHLEEKIKNYPEWKVLGLGYISQYSHLILPSALAFKLQESIVETYPFLFTYVNLKSDSISNCSQEFLPIRQLYGEVVEDFTFWPLPPLSDIGISITLVRCAGKTRLFVLSPFQSMDTVLTHRCNQYLIKLAEDVGVDKNRIPYSRRSSPSSSNCSTPLSCVNPADILGFRSCLRRSESLSNNANY